MLKFRLLLFFILIAVISIKGQTTTAYDFMKLDINPRAAVIGGGFVANYDDPNVIFYNPAGISSLKNRPVSFSFLNHIEDIKVVSAAYSHEFENIGRFAVGVQYIGYGDFVRADASGNKLGSFSAGDLAFTVGYSNQLDKNFYYGANVKFINSSIDDVSSSAIAADVGLQYIIPDQKLSFGFSVQNIGTQISKYFDKEEDLPLDIKVGASKELAHLPLRFYVALNRLNDEDERFKSFSLGGEFKLSKVLRLRLGYDSDKREDWKLGNASAGLAGFSIGIGILVKNYNVDYAYSSMGEIGGWHRIGITTDI